MTRRGVLLLALVLGGWSSAATAADIACPATAPAEWGIGNAPLQDVQVLQARVGETIDPNAPPSLVPDLNEQHGTTIHQVWQLDNDAGWLNLVDCHYRGTTRVLQLDVTSANQCERTITGWTKTGFGPQTRDRMVCR